MPENKKKSKALQKSEDELRAVFSVIMDQPGGREAMEKMAIELLLPVEERVRREQPDHPALPLLDAWRAKQKNGT